ncbi:MAG: hypothetical protein FJ296_11420, partial [Planctomycetes bacterium]|nr:hypothetical protein [Planctomycetota bacterium]
APAPQPASRPRGTRPRVAVFGVDGATFAVIDPLVRQGRLPVLARLMQRGVRVVLRSEIAEGASPVLWTSISTGVRKDEHGILGFTHNDVAGVSVYSSHDRRVPALWDMVGARGGSVGLAGHWCTWPAEPVDGWIVSDLFATSLLKRNFGSGAQQGLTWPADLVEELRPLVHEPSELRREELAPLGEFDDAEWAAMMADDAQREFVLQDGLAALKYGLQAQRTCAEVALHLLRTRPQPDYLFVMLELPDRVSHNFWHAWEPEKVRAGALAVHAGWRARWNNVVPGSYDIVDAHIGMLLAELDPDTTVFVVSDHGFRSNGRPGGSPIDLTQVGRSGTHDADGILIAAGPAILPGSTCEARIYDVAPTVLAAMGLPLSLQPIGRVLRPLLAPEFLAAHPLQAEQLEQPLEHVDLPAQAPDDERLRQMQAVGYLPGAAQEVPDQDDGQ